MSRAHLLVTAVAIVVLYGSTYQQFRFFSLDRPGGAADAVHYVEMAEGAPIVDPEMRHYRWLTPSAARLLTPITDAIVHDRELSIRLAFYLVNFMFSVIAANALFRLLHALGYSSLLSLLGVTLFASSRIVVIATATPMVDAGYFCAIAIMVWLTVERRTLALAMVLPLLVLTRETVIPFMLLPLLTELRKSPAIWAGLAVAALTYASGRLLIGSQYSGADPSAVATIVEHVQLSGETLARLFTPAGIHDLQNGFSLLLPLGIAGAWLNARYRYHHVPSVVVAAVPIALLLAVLSGNLGRMFFAAFPAVIAYALIAVEHFAAAQSQGDLAH